MCTEVKPHAGTEKIDNLPVTGRLFIHGKDRPILVATDRHTVEHMLNDTDRTQITVVNIHGEATVVPKVGIVSYVEDVPKQPRVDIQPDTLWGKKYTFRGLPAFNIAQVQADRPLDTMDVPEGDSERNYVAVVTEDRLVADALVLVVNPATGDILWANPAEPERSIRRLVKAARLICEAEVLMLEANTPPSTQVPEPGDNG